MTSLPTLTVPPARATAPQRRGWPWDAVPTAAAPEPAESRSTPPDGGWPRISVVIPSFNQGEFLEEALRSLLLQGYPDLEILVMDGGSGDDSVAVLEHYDEHLAAWSSGPDGGQSDAINRGFQRATGSLITFFGSDDVYAPGALAAVAHLSAQYPKAGVLAGAFRFIDADSQPTSAVIPPRLPGHDPRRPDTGRGGKPSQSLDLAFVPPSDWRLHQVSCFYSAAALDAVGRRVQEDLRYTMDRELLYRVLRHAPAALSADLWANFRRHGASKSVADILPFAEEMATLQFIGAADDENATQRHRRRRIANYRRARGRLKLARARAEGGEGLLRRCAPLVAALRHQPTLVGSRGFARHWARAFGLLRDKPTKTAGATQGLKP